MERLLCNKREENFLIVSGSEFKHLKALRLRKGEKFEVYCEGRLFLASLSEVLKDYAICSILEEIEKPLPKPSVVLYQCLPLDLRLMEEVVDRVSQAGAVRLVPLMCRRGFREIHKVEERLERWRKLSLASFKQCKRPKPMEVSTPLRLEDFKPEEEVLLLLDNFTANLTLRDIDLRSKSYGLVVGPEGGFSREEVDFLKSRGCLPLLLKPYVYRSEMAGAVAVALIMNLARD
ncbi:MAG: RsmE family RNA methyltransferase [Aquificaceae bacterium]|nr:RsmE family RNA methyltransferase [Aquificaceae bacterium]